MLPQELIRKKRDARRLTRPEIDRFVQGLTDGSISPEQVAAMAMAIYLNGMDAAETGGLTQAMLASGQVIDWTDMDLPGPVVDKHSTGGVGDKVSLVLAPLIAACGGYDPMISGRALGHGGGTLDKLDSIPGYDTAPDLATFKAVVKSTGCAIIGQTADLAPADRRLYAIRDVTATVESIPLITASILSKKLAAGLDGLCMDVKTGNGAFMASLEQAEALAAAIIGAAAEVGLPVRAIISDMSEPLGSTAGNALEVREAVDYLLGHRREPRLHEVIIALAAEMLCMASLAADRRAAEKQALAVLDDGRAAEVFARMVSALGGPHDFMEGEQAGRYLPRAAVIEPVSPDQAGFVQCVDVRRVGNAIVDMGGGRRRTDAPIDHAVGLTEIAPAGAAVDEHRPLGIIHAGSAADAQCAAASLRAAVTIGEQRPPPGRVIIKSLTQEEVQGEHGPISAENDHAE